jgi:hypothetical protein
MSQNCSVLRTFVLWTPHTDTFDIHVVLRPKLDHWKVGRDGSSNGARFRGTSIVHFATKYFVLSYNLASDYVRKQRNTEVKSGSLLRTSTCHFLPAFCQLMQIVLPMFNVTCSITTQGKKKTALSISIPHMVTCGDADCTSCAMSPHLATPDSIKPISPAG